MSNSSPCTEQKLFPETKMEQKLKISYQNGNVSKRNESWRKNLIEFISMWFPISRKNPKIEFWSPCWNNSYEKYAYSNLKCIKMCYEINFNSLEFIIN